MCHQGHCWAASELMLAGAAVRVITTNGRTPMFVAAEKGLGEMIRIMIQKCDVRQINSPYMLLLVMVIFLSMH